MLKIEQALPDIFKRTYPILQPGTQLLLAASLLRFHEIDAIPIGFERGQKEHLAVFGYSCLSNMLKADPATYRSILEQPCEKAAKELATVTSDSGLDQLLGIFEKTGFGFVWVEGEFELGALVSLRDVLDLYDNGTLETDLRVDEVASSIYSMPSEAKIRDALEEMFRRGFRRIFLDYKKDRVITDRRIIAHIFSAGRLAEAMGNSEDLLDEQLKSLEAMRPKSVRGNPNLKKAANEMKTELEECLVSEKGVVTPWDIVMKPWKMGKLSIK